MIDFQLIKTTDQEVYKKFQAVSGPRGCEMSFANLFLWGEQKIAIKNDCMFFLSTFSRSFYPFPCSISNEDGLKWAIEEIIADAKERGIPCEITSIGETEKVFLEKHFNGKFEFITNDGSYDYVYNINDLADLLGKKYHKKRNHLNNFKKAHPNYTVESITELNKSQVIKMVEGWYDEKSASTTNNFDYEIDFFKRAMQNYRDLGFEGLILKDDGKVIAVTFASFLYEHIMDVHFEKALADIDGAYTVINNEFAKYVREKFPNVKFLDREEDMGLEGLRRAKQSYYPSYQVVKYSAKYKGSI